MFVTNAPIYTARYDASAVSSEGGEFTTAPDDVTAPPFVRFQKRFASGSVSDLGDRVFFVVNARPFVEFLSLIRPEPDDYLDRLDVGSHGLDSTHRAGVGNELLNIHPRRDGPDENNMTRVNADVDPA